MSRTGIEAKPPWKIVPKAVRRQVDTALGAPVVRAARIWGGYSPTPTLGEWMPQLYATFHQDDWHVLLLEDLGPKSVPPWTPGKTRAITQALATFHQASFDSQPPSWLSRPVERLSLR